MVDAIFGAAPAFLLGAYLMSATIYCYKKGNCGWKRSVNRDEEPLNFAALLIILGAAGAALIFLALYRIARVLIGL